MPELTDCLNHHKVSKEDKDFILKARAKYKGLPEIEANRKALLDYHKSLHDELNGLKKTLKIPQDKYVPFDKSDELKNINADYDKQIEDAKNISSQIKPKENASTQSSEQQQESIQQGSIAEHARTEQAGSESKTTETKSSDSNIGSTGRQKEKGIAAKGKELADKIRQLKTRQDKLQTNIFGIPIAIYDGALETVATAIEKGSELAEAIQKGIEYIGKKAGFDEENFRKHIEDFAAGEKPKIKVQVGGEETIPKVKTDERRFTKQMLRDEELTNENKSAISDTLNYAIQSNSMSIEEARNTINKLGADESYNLVTDLNNDLNGGVRSVMGQALIKKYNELASKATDEGDKNYYHDKTIKIAKYVTEKLATDAGQSIQAFSLWSRLSPEAQLRDAVQDAAIQAKEKIRKRTPDINKISDKFKKANEETVAEITKSTKVKEAVNKVESSRVKKAKDKIEQARKKRTDIIKKYKGNKGKNLYSTIGLTTEGIEFVGDIAKTYLDEGIAQLEIIVDKVLSHLKEVSGKIPDDEVKRNVNDIVFEKLYDIQNEKIAKGLREIESNINKTLDQYKFVPDALKQQWVEKISSESKLSESELPEFKNQVAKEIDKIIERKKEKNVPAPEQRIKTSLSELEKEINDIVTEHYTVTDAQKKSLIDKFVERAKLDKSDAAQLATEIQTEFDRIATRKKQNILYNEKAAFERIQNRLQGVNKVDTKSLQYEMIRYSNLGAFENPDFSKMISEKLGVGEITKEEAAKIMELADKVEQAPEGSPKNDATEDLLKYRANLKGNSFAEMMQGMWYANVLSGYKTHEKNIVSTFFNGMAFYATEAAKNPRSIPFLTVGGLKGLKRGAIEAWHTLATGRSPIHIKKIETPQVLERQGFVGGYLNPANWLKFVSRAMIAEDVLQFQGLKEMRAHQLAYREARKLGNINPFSATTWRKVNELLLNTKERLDIATAQVKEEGLAGTEAKRRTYELMEDSRPVPMTEDAYGFAAKGTFNHNTEGTLGALTNAIAVALDVPIGGVRPLRFIVPFTRIITNVVNNALDFSPIGLLRAARGVRGFESFEKYSVTKPAFRRLTVEERHQLIAKAALGIGIAAAFQAMHNAGIIQLTGGGTGDYKKDAQLALEGWQPYSIKIGDTYYSYKLTPLVFTLGFLGNMNDKKKFAKDESDATMLKRIELASYRTAHLISDMTWINSGGTLLGAFQNQNSSSFGAEMGNSLEQSAKGFVIPQAYTQAAQEIEHIYNAPQKQVNGFWQNMVQDIPIARNSLNDKINALGEPIVRDVDVFTSEQTKDKVWNYLFDKNGWVAPVNKNSLILYDGKTQQDRPATDDEYYSFSKARGGKIKADIQGIIENGAWTTIDEKGNETVTTNPNLVTGIKPADQLTPTELQKLLKAFSTAATKETKKEFYYKQILNNQK